MAYTYIGETQVNFLKHSGHCLWYFVVGEWIDPQDRIQEDNTEGW